MTEEEIEAEERSVKPKNVVKEYEGFKLGEIVLYDNKPYKIYEIDLNSGIYLEPLVNAEMSSFGLGKVTRQVLDHRELTKAPNLEVLYGKC